MVYLSIRFYGGFLLFLCFCFNAFAFSIEELSQELEDIGFENIDIVPQESNSIRIVYENRAFRNDLIAAGVVAALAVKVEKTSIKDIILVPLNRGIPLVEIKISKELYLAFFAGEIEREEFAGSLVLGDSNQTVKQKGSLNSSYQKFDITIHPGFKLQLGNYEDRYKPVLDIKPELSTSLWAGNSISAQMTIPVHDEIGTYTDEVRLARLTVSQVVKLPLSGFAAFSVGAFNPDRWGLSAELGYFLFQKHLLVGSKIDYTGFLLYQNKQWNYSKLNKTTSRSYINYFFDGLDVSVGVNYSHYLMGDKGWGGEVTRTFGETRLGAFFTKTDFEKFGGIKCRIPLRPVKRFRPKLIRVNIPNYYDMSYKATNMTYTIGAPSETGVSIDSGFDLLDFQKNMTTTYIRNNIDMWRTAVKYLNSELH